MNKRLPTISESAADLKTQMRQETHPKKRQRLQALYLLASAQAQSRLALAALLGVNRNSVRRWLDAYAHGGLAALLTIGTPPGKPLSLNPSQLQQLESALAQPEGFRSYKEVQRWLASELGVPLRYRTVHELVRYRLGAKLKRPRPSNAKKK